MTDDLVVRRSDDYYAFLNVSKNANIDEIRNSFRLLSKQFHPDKHTNPSLKRHAELMFDKLKKAYDVLSDPNKRAVYDVLGESGLNNEGWALVEKKFKSAKEIKEEYEQLVKEKEQRILQQRTTPKGSFTVMFDATNLFQPQDNSDDNRYVLSLSSVEVRSMTITQSIDSPLTVNNHWILNGMINVHNGIGSGNLSLGLRHIFNPKTWGEIEFGGGQGPLMTLKGFRSLTPNLHANLQTSFYNTSFGLQSGFSCVLTRHFGKHLAGHLSYKTGIDSSMSTTMVFENSYCRVNGSLQFGINNSFISSSYTHKFKRNRLRVKVGVKYGLLGSLFDYGCETKISEFSTLGAALTIGNSGVNLRIKLIRNNQNYIFPILLCEEVLPGSIIFGTIIPLLSYYVIKKYIVDVYIQKMEKEEINKEQQENAALLKEKRNEAIAYTELMKDFYDRIIQRERSVDGLIIEKALYGDPALVEQYNNSDVNLPIDANAFDFKVALQVLVNDQSRLILTSCSKSSLPGFYDPYINLPKKLSIKYKFRSRDYYVLVDEHESVILPSERHLVLSINEDHFN